MCGWTFAGRTYKKKSVYVLEVVDKIHALPSASSIPLLEARAEIRAVRVGSRSLCGSIHAALYMPSHSHKSFEPDSPKYESLIPFRNCTHVFGDKKTTGD